MEGELLVMGTAWLYAHMAQRKRIKGASRVKGDLCKGCGTCAASCPERAIIMSHFNRRTDHRSSYQAL